ncbi:MAG: RNA polymerase sigma factor [Clostridiaceae bacterium]
MELLIKKAQKGDKEAFIQAIDEYMTQMYKVAKSRLDSDDDIGDAMQDTILSAYRSLKTLRKPRYFKTWIIKILINKCNNIMSKSKHIIYVDDYSKVSRDTDMGVYDSDVEEELDFTETLKILNEDYRTVIVLYYVNGFTSKEISEILDEKEGTIKSRLSRARQQLKEHYMTNNLLDNSLKLNLGGHVR